MSACHVVRLLAQSFERLVSPEERIRDVTRFGKRLGQQRGDLLFVFDNQNAHHFLYRVPMVNPSV